MKVIITVRGSEEEHQMLVQEAIKAGLPLAQYARVKLGLPLIKRETKANTKSEDNSDSTS